MSPAFATVDCSVEDIIAMVRGGVTSCLVAACGFVTRGVDKWTSEDLARLVKVFVEAVKNSGGRGRESCLEVCASVLTRDSVGKALAKKEGMADVVAGALLEVIEGNCGEENLMEEETMLRLMKVVKVDFNDGSYSFGVVSQNFSTPQAGSGALCDGLEYTQVSGLTSLGIERAAARTLCNLCVGERESVVKAVRRVGVEKGMCEDEMAELYLEVLWEGEAGEEETEPERGFARRK